MPRDRSCKCGSALAHAILTDPKKIPAGDKKEVETDRRKVPAALYKIQKVVPSCPFVSLCG